MANISGIPAMFGYGRIGSGLLCGFSLKIALYRNDTPVRQFGTLDEGTLHPVGLFKENREYCNEKSQPFLFRLYDVLLIGVTY